MTTDLNETNYQGSSNPSAAEALNDSHFVVADDEDNVLRVYPRRHPGKPLQEIGLSKVFKGLIEDGDGLEIDIEGAARIGNAVFWIGSHSTNREGEDRPTRQRLFAVTFRDAANGKYEVTPAGGIYTTLIDDLINDPCYDRFHLKKARRIAPKDIGGLSIEGLASTVENSLLIGFRNPLRGGKVENGRLQHGRALLVELKNPFEVINGLPAKFGDPIELDLNGFGIRDITRRTRHKYLIVGGPYHANDQQPVEVGRLYEWSIKTGKLIALKSFDLTGYNIEAAIFYPESNEEVQLLSDDGKNKQVKGFRSINLALK